MTLLAICFWEMRLAYLAGMVERIAARAPLHPERLRTERELAEARRRLRHLHRRLE